MGPTGQHGFADGGSGTKEPTGRRSSSSRTLIDVHGRPKPLLRGRLHAVVFVATVPAGAVLLGAADTALSSVAAAIYAVSLALLFGASSAYHCLGRTVTSQLLLRRLDHASIYVLIAGSYTPLCLLVLPGLWRWSMLAAIWSAAAVGVATKMARFHLSVFGAVLYVAMGWAALVAVPLLVTRLAADVLVLLALGGILYTGGAVVLARQRPDPWPRTFGYHEIWHTMVVVAGGCHYAVILHIVRAS